MDAFISWLIDIVLMIRDLPMVAPLSSSMSAAFAVPLFLVLLFLWYGGKMLLDVLLLLLVSVLVLSIAQQGTDLLNVVYAPIAAVAAR
ncbi:MAG TPA: hypothetical protein VFK88_09910 [Gallionella sp.]|nr:hypothetical protein [Gallionella sp.]